MPTYKIKSTHEEINLFKHYTNKVTGDQIALVYADYLDLDPCRTYNKFGTLVLDLGEEEGEDVYDETDGEPVDYSQVVAAYAVEVKGLYLDRELTLSLGKRIDTKEEFEQTVNKFFITKDDLEIHEPKPDEFEIILKAELQKFMHEKNGDVFALVYHSRDEEAEEDIDYPFFGEEEAIGALKFIREDLEETPPGDWLDFVED